MHSKGCHNDKSYRYPDISRSTDCHRYLYLSLIHIFRGQSHLCRQGVRIPEYPTTNQYHQQNHCQDSHPTPHHPRRNVVHHLLHFFLSLIHILRHFNSSPHRASHHGRYQQFCRQHLRTGLCTLLHADRGQKDGTVRQRPTAVQR